MINTSLNFDAPGKQQGFLQVPYSHNLGGWANVMIPCTVIARGKGPTVLILAGNHGDEYEGQVILARLIRALEPIEGIQKNASGPGRLCRALDIDLSHNKIDVTRGPLFVAGRGDTAPPIAATHRRPRASGAGLRRW